MVLEKKEKSNKKPLELEDYRKDKMLRDLVRQAIVEQHPNFFNEIMERNQKGRTDMNKFQEMYRAKLKTAEK